ncbi:hypothetical protein BDZ45DRAFT_737900 [Acephala macrosclerotiorum]|nr:hypothetical protein BDZ45DRAFT_737900 [Acephala macrosclerotiorum]
MECRRSRADDQGCLPDLRDPFHHRKDRQDKANIVPRNAKCIPTTTIYSCGHGSQRIAHVNCHGAPPGRKYCTNMATSPKVIRAQSTCGDLRCGLQSIEPKKSATFKYKNLTRATPSNQPDYQLTKKKGELDTDSDTKEDDWENISSEKETGAEECEDWVWISPGGE